MALDPGRPDPSLPNRGLLHDGAHLGLQASQTNVNTDEVIAMLDVDTRDYLRTLLDAGGQGLRTRGEDLAAAPRAQRADLPRRRSGWSARSPRAGSRCGGS